MCDKLENQAFYANANAHRPPSGRSRQQQQQQCTFSLTSFYHFAFSPVCLLLLYVFFVFSFFFCFFYFLLHTVFANYSSKRNYSYATFSILIKTAAHTQFRSSSSFDIFVCLSKYLWSRKRQGGGNLSWLLCKEIKCILSEINFIAALGEREREGCGVKLARESQTRRLEYAVWNPHWFLYCNFIWLRSYEITYTQCWDKHWNIALNSHQRYQRAASDPQSARDDNDVCKNRNNPTQAQARQATASTSTTATTIRQHLQR